MEKDNGKKPAPAEKRREILDALQQEMEIAEYATSETGQQRRKVPRHESADRTKKRKILEKVDHQQRSMTTDNTKRKRGSQYALEQDVVHGSQVYADEEKDDNNDDGMEVDAIDETLLEEGDEEAGDEQGEGEEAGAIDEEVALLTAKSTAKPPAKKPAAAAAKGKGKKRLMYKMRNFKSARMAERHGDALGAHARGQSLQALRKLEEVAEDAPAAPQVYSSLGMVYESILSDSRKKSTAALDEEEEEISIESIGKQLGLAKKAYGSYHVAALLCKKDFSLWVRAGDTAKEIADLYTDAMASSDTQSEKREEYREEKRKWTEEAKKDYLAADHLRPPGIDVPAKLAAVQMELGNLSEALVILTDLKNRSADMGETHNEFEKSYKAWLLYADLMLRIGHECTEWNQGNQRNPNYMFKRWLRKWSSSFDWKQRRLQALVQALEAAAGTTCCENLIAWSKNRASAAQGDEGAPADHRRWHVDLYEIAKDPPQAAKKGDEESKDDDDAAGDESNAIGATATSGQDSVWSLESAREALLAKNRLELEAFDEETSNLGLVAGSDSLQQRATARSALIKSHRKSVVDLVGNYQQHHTALQEAAAAAPSAQVGDNGNLQRAAEPLPITGSCTAVCAIASDLMKHCLRSNLYEGCRLVGEAVSAYLKERAGLLERRLEANRTFEERQKSTDNSVLLSMEAYDEVGEDESDDDADALYFSDDEVILESPDEHLVPSLKNGILPPELRLLYALSLIGEGGRAFLARQCIKAIEDLKADDIDALISDPIDTNIVQDSLWYGFRQDLTEPLHKTAAFALVVDVLQKAGKEAEFADTVTPMLQKHLEDLESTGQIDIALFGSGAAVSQLAVPTRNRVIQLILASARMQIEHVKSIASVRESDVDIALAVLDRVIPLLQKVWKVEASGSIPSFCIKGMELLARTFSFLSSASKDANVEARVLAKLLEVLSLVCGVVIPNPLTSVLSEGENPFKDWTNFPVSAGWQNMSDELLSKRLYNLLIGCLVWNFSGWEMDEFNLDLLRASRRKGQPFGINITGDRVKGCLSPSTEAKLVNQWEQIVELLPQFSEFDFNASLNAAKSSSWYKEVVDEMEKSGEMLSAYGEKDAFELFLTLSGMCLKAATSAPADGMKSYALMKLALSVVLPLSEFCLDEDLWESPIGKAAIAKTAKVYDWNKVARSVGQDKPEERVTKRTRAQPVPKPIEAPPQKRRAIPTMVPIPVSVLLSQWNDGVPWERSDSEEAKEAMRKVNTAVKQLRQCYTEMAIQKGCIQVALSLMELAGSGFAYNPFLCLQQAAIFASQGAKGGKNDEAFKAGLPKEQECSPQEAMLVIGRADCLHSLDFADEAVFLCSFVARVCRLHRDRQEEQAEWNNKWKVVGICLYNLSVAIHTTRSLHGEKSPPEEYFDASVSEELKHGRADAIAVKATLPDTTGVASLVDPQGESESHDEEDNFDDNDQEGQAVLEETYLDGEVEMMDASHDYNFRPSAIFASNGGAAAALEDDEDREIVAV